MLETINYVYKVLLLKLEQKIIPGTWFSCWKLRSNRTNLALLESLYYLSSQAVFSVKVWNKNWTTGRTCAHREKPRETKPQNTQTTSRSRACGNLHDQVRLLAHTLSYILLMLSYLQSPLGEEAQTSTSSIRPLTSGRVTAQVNTAELNLEVNSQRQSSHL